MAKRNLNEVLGFISRWGESEFSLRLLDEALTSAALAKKAMLSDNPEEQKRLEARSLKRLQDEKKHEKILQALIDKKNKSQETPLETARRYKALNFKHKMTTSDEIKGERPSPKPEPTGSPEKPTKPEPTGSPEEPKEPGKPPESIKISRLRAAAGIGTNILSGARALGDSMFGPTGSTVPGAIGAVRHSLQAAGNVVRTITGKVPLSVLDTERAHRLLGDRRYRGHHNFLQYRGDHNFPRNNIIR